MKLSREEVGHIATLARLKLSEEEIAKYQDQISGILDYVEKLGAVDTSEVEPTSQVTGLTNISREDRIIESGIEKELVACAPESADGFVVIPKIFEHKN